MNINIITNGPTATMTLSGKIDEQHAEVLKKNFYELNFSLLDHIILDFQHVSHIGSAGIGKLLLFYKDFAIKGGRISLKNVSKPLYDVFKVVKLDTLMDINPA